MEFQSEMAESEHTFDHGSGGVRQLHEGDHFVRLILNEMARRLAGRIASTMVCTAPTGMSYGHGGNKSGGDGARTRGEWRLWRANEPGGRGRRSGAHRGFSGAAQGSRGSSGGSQSALMATGARA